MANRYPALGTGAQHALARFLHRIAAADVSMARTNEAGYLLCGELMGLRQVQLQPISHAQRSAQPVHVQCA
jgi:hypothetical protein